MKIYSINITNFKVDGGAMFGVVPKVLWVKKYPADENNLCNFSLRSLLIDTGEKRILIDNGFGDKQDDKFFDHFHLNETDTLENLLSQRGYTTDDITDVVITHLHYDHCGGGVKRNSRGEYEMIFKNAIYLVSRSHWEWAIHPNDREAASFLKENLFPMEESGQLKFIGKDAELFPGISVRLYNGHTLGQVIPFINYKGRTIVFVADLIPTTAHVPLPYIASYDMFPNDTLQEKKDFLHEAVEKNYVLFFQHDLFHECCTLKETPKGIRVNKTFTLDGFKNNQG